MFFLVLQRDPKSATTGAGYSVVVPMFVYARFVFQAIRLCISTRKSTCEPGRRKPSGKHALSVSSQFTGTQVKFPCALYIACIVGVHRCELYSIHLLKTQEAQATGYEFKIRTRISYLPFAPRGETRRNRLKFCRHEYTRL